MFTSRMLYFLFAIVAILAFAFYVASSTKTAAPAPGSTSPPPVVIPTKTPTAAEKGASLWYKVDLAWGSDWPQVLSILIQLEALQGRTPKVAEKLYAAHVNYAETLLRNGYRLEAAGEFNNALEVNPDGGEAKQELLSLTPAQ